MQGIAAFNQVLTCQGWDNQLLNTINLFYDLISKNLSLIT